MTFVRWVRRTFDLPPPDDLSLDPTGKDRLDDEWVGRYQEEKVSVLLRLIWRSGEIGGSRRTFEYVAMAVSGVILMAPLALVLGWFGAWWGGLLVALAGVGKGGAYAVGWAAHDRFGPVGPRHLKMGTEVGEALTGLLLYAAGAAGVLFLT